MPEVDRTTEQKLLVPIEQYLAAGTYIGTKVRTKDMAKFIYKINQQGLCTLNLAEIDKRLRYAAKLLSKYSPNDILVVCRRENGWKAARAFGKYTGIKVFTEKYPAGIMTNLDLKNFIEPKILFVTDPLPDRNAVHDAFVSGIPIIALCDTNNTFQYIDFVIPCNNKGVRSLGLIYWILATEYLRERGQLQQPLPQEDFF
ncbi:MAG: 30S ribosomal protein S2 [Candidatus Nanoarchaeia archaeon]